MNLCLSYASFLVFAIVFDIPVLNVSISTESPFAQGEQTTLENSKDPQTQNVYLSLSYDKKAVNQSSELSSDKTIHLDKLIAEISKKETRQITRPDGSKPCDFSDSKNVPQNTTELSISYTRAVSRHVGCSTLTTTTITPFGNGKVIRLKKQLKPKTSRARVSSSCSTEPGQRLCGCTSVCTQLNNCCYDSDYVNADQDSIANRTQYSCYENLGAKWLLSSPSRLVDKCLPPWTDDSVRQRCEAPTTSDFEIYLPCVSPETNLVYKNVYCLRCNGLVNFSPWELTFLSSVPFHYFEINTFVKTHAIHNTAKKNRHIYFSVSPPSDQEPFHCLPLGVHSCNDEFNNNGTLSNMCQAYYDPVLVNDVPYRNVNCFRCSTNKSSENIVGVSRTGAAMSFGVVLKFSNALHIQGKKCSEETCLPVVSHIQGYSEEFQLSVTIVNRDNTTLNVSTTNAINRYWQWLYRMNMLSMLPGLNSTVSYPLHRNVSTVVVKIAKEISIEEIPLIQKTIRSVSMQANYSDTVTVSCYVTESSSKQTKPIANDHRDGKQGDNFVNYLNAADSSKVAFSVVLLCLAFNML